MAIKEQFESLDVRYGAEGIVGTRVFVCTWAERKAWTGLPKLGDAWTPTGTGWTEMLWVHDVHCLPYGMSASAGGDAASNCKIIYTYKSKPLILTEPKNWIVTSKLSLQALTAGAERTFSTEGGGGKVPERQAVLVPMIEIVVEGEEEIDSTATTADLTEPRNAHLLGHVNGGLGDTRWKDIRGHVVGFPAESSAELLLFEGEEVGEPFYRQIGTEAIRYRRFTRHFLVRVVHWLDTVETLYPGPTTHMNANGFMSAHNYVWNPDINKWDLVTPDLYRAGDMVECRLFPFTEVV